MKSDAISRSAVLKEIDWAIDLATDDEMHHAMCTLGERFKELPALDVAPVVRCKDCKHRFTRICPMFFEEHTYSDDEGYYWVDHDRTTDNGFCDEGERMDGEAE